MSWPQGKNKSSSIPAQSNQRYIIVCHETNNHFCNEDHDAERGSARARVGQLQAYRTSNAKLHNGLVVLKFEAIFGKDQSEFNQIRKCLPPYFEQPTDANIGQRADQLPGNFRYTYGGGTFLSLRGSTVGVDVEMSPGLRTSCLLCKEASANQCMSLHRRTNANTSASICFRM